MNVAVVCRPGCRRIPVPRLRDLVRQVLRSVSPGAGDVSILLTRDAEVRALNLRFRGQDRPTDVLSFPFSAATPEGDPYLGDIAISVERAAAQAHPAGRTTGEEIQFLVLHGLLHLLGYDHETDQGKMNRLQSDLARRHLHQGVSPRRNRPIRGRHLLRKKAR